MAERERQIWRIVDVLKWSRDYLKGKQIESPQIEAEWILREVLNLNRLEIYLKYERPLSPAELARIRALLLKRASGQPIQYVLGSAEFMGLKLRVTPDVLIPRPETELLVEKTLELCRNRVTARILDIGTGSGCIAIALAHFLPECQVVAIDVSATALQIARENAAIHNVANRIDFQELDILHSPELSMGQFDIIVSNPPYVSGDYYVNLPKLVKEHEPEIALNPGTDGLLFYRRIKELASEIAIPGGAVVLEIGGDYQATAVAELFSESAFDSVAIVKDYSGQSRVIIAELAK